ncbi:MAG TPA: hypothetical protein VFT50_09880 [Baekduia sp.]|nr:hypothetical protein [Baekduia sp.]
MLDPRLYRVAFVPVLLALLVAAFSLQDRPRGSRTSFTAEGFGGVEAANTLDDLERAYAHRRPGSDGDEQLAQLVAQRLRSTVPGTVEVHRYRADTIDGARDLVDVVATRPGAPGPGLVVVAHRDAAATGAKAELSSTAALLELAAVAADGRLRRTITFISTSGGSGGFAGAVEEARRLGDRADAILVLGDVASADERRPFVVPFSNGLGQAPIALQRTVEAAVRSEVGAGPGTPRAMTQWARMAVPVTVSEQGPFLRAGQPAVLLSASGERPPAASAQISQDRLTRFGRAALRVLMALDTSPDLAQPPRADLVIRGKIMPGWAVRLLVGSLLVPPLLVSIDAFARLRRRREPVGRWAAWALTGSLPFLVACAFAVLLGALGLIAAAPPAPIPAAGLSLGAGPVAAFVAILVVFGLGWLLVRPAVLRLAAGRAGALRRDAPGAAIGLALTTSLVAVALWVVNPYAAALVVPGLHLWLWATAPDLDLRRPLAVGLVVLGLLPLLALGLGDSHAFGLDAAHAVWFWTLLVAGGHVPLGSWLLWSLVWGCAISAGILALRGRPDEPTQGGVTVRGPVTYAGPGSLGGTESALRW